MALISALIVTPLREAILLHESPLTTGYVAPGHAGALEGPTALAIAAIGTSPTTNISVAKSHRPEVDAVRGPAPLCWSDTGGTVTPFAYKEYRHA